MRIARVGARWLHAPIPSERQHVSDFGRVASFDMALIEIESDDGRIGWGEAKAAVGSAGACAAIVATVEHELGPALIGRDPRRVNAALGADVQRDARRPLGQIGPSDADPRPARAHRERDQRGRHGVVGHAGPLARRARARTLGWVPPTIACRRTHRGGWADATAIGEQLGELRGRRVLRGQDASRGDGRRRGDECRTRPLPPVRASVTRSI